MPPTDDDPRWLDAAASLAIRARPLSTPNPCVAAIIVNRGRVIARGWTGAGGRPHAEAIALQQAGSAAHGGTMHVTLEPCAHLSARGPACADLLAASGLAKVVIGCGDPDSRTNGQGIARLRGAGIAVELADHAPSRTSLAGFLTRQTRGRPHITLKLAVSRDGFIGPLSGEPVMLTGAVARAHVHRQRALAEAILVGGATLRNDAPRLDVRLPGLEARSPRRMVLTRGPAPAGWEQLPSPQAVHDLHAMQFLYVEGGAATAQAFLAAGLVDQLIIYRAPVTLGAGIPAYGALGPAVDGAPPAGFVRVDQRRLGSDMLFTYQPATTGDS
ncbi:bifunctional diaminohydroxyphosphoribosylaminopyrimidine deaminase/5-amino-6-(5-phosphoribosylamino)uracil reductase RibD [Alteraurantiacibacter aestuarii]|uniref:bifunctional diaminohydroxyphosphoribosylaminopyrimidine deaminase/5-amino-6-(5-phosphoribosylamino)uracil reductase RibD n=1 Tax=Alteraurantiacibacter aestuarii TaxID=650004 RepID=UPI001EEEF762|nr:bifunctional diaminohydroxyphosphoribosylaminopyrimidine deaminase/5-amino-6-(5-phosphoribosylamino)uracil reductase RibD [Alteraurantiacibacter aestuarii]